MATCFSLHRPSSIRYYKYFQNKFSCYFVAVRFTLPASWSSGQSLTTNHEVPGSIPGSTVRIFPEGEDSRGDHGLGRLVEFRFTGPPDTPSSYITTHNVTAPQGRTNLRSRLHCCHAQEGGPRSPQGHVMALDQKKNLLVNTPFHNLTLFSSNLDRSF